MVPPPPPPTSSYLETELERGSHSLPSVEEARTQGALNGVKNRHSGKNKRTIALVAILVATIALVVGFSVAAVQNSRKSSSNASKSQDLNNDGTPDTADENETDDMERLDQIHIFLLGSAISSKADLTDSSKPQYKAAQWIANEDDSDIPETNDYETAYPFVQRYIMAVFYYALDGPNWPKQLSFLSTDLDTCDWNINIEVKDPPPGTDETNFDFGVSCWDDEAEEYSDVVTYIFITNNGLKGSLPSEIGLLDDLVHLSLFHNEISGSIPDSMQNLENLNYWAMSSNQISGKLPSWIGQMDSLTDLALSDNLLTGPLPSFVDSLLEELTLDGNALEGSIDPLNDALNLQVAYLGNNAFDSQLSESTFDNLDDLDILDLKDNQLLGTFPSSFYWFSEIDLSDNQLTAMSLVDYDDFQQMPIRFLSVANNDIGGAIPHNIGSLSLLTVLDLSRNEFTGSIPISIVDLKSLQALYLFQNPSLQEGLIPDMRDSSNLVEFSLAATNRKGTIYTWFSNLAKLETLDLQGNKLYGAIPTQIGDMDSLAYLYLNSNKLTGSVPSQLRYLSNLAEIAINDNEFTSGSLDPVCKYADFITADAGIFCQCDCLLCDATDTDCNPVEDIDKGFVDVTRETYTESEDIEFGPASVTP